MKRSMQDDMNGPLDRVHHSRIVLPGMNAVKSGVVKRPFGGTYSSLLHESLLLIVLFSPKDGGDMFFRKIE
jgi:hypothetical protein